MYSKELEELQKISQAVGNSPDLVQGGGGNTSVKLNEELMAVKASGYKLSQITPKEGFVVVNYKNIKGYYENVDLSSDIDYEQDSVAFVKQNVVEMEGLQSLRPSVEAGFHSVLKKYVIHSHSVYANIVCSSQEGKSLADKIFGDSYLWIPYINPGFSLTLKIKDGIQECIKKKGQFPEVILMENHGLIVHTNDCEQCIDLHQKVNQRIKDYLKIENNYPAIDIVQLEENTYASKTRYLTEFLGKGTINDDFFKQYLCPDQLVYLDGNVSINAEENKLNIDTTTGKIIYKTSKAEARTIEETLLAFIYVVNNIKKCNLILKTMSKEEVAFIQNWESEKYRKSMIKK